MSSLSRFAGLGRGDKCGGDYYRLRREAWTGECGMLGFWEAEKARRRCRWIAGRAHASDAGLRLLGHDGCHSCLAVMLRVLWFLGNAGESLRSTLGKGGGAGWCRTTARRSPGRRRIPEGHSTLG